MPGLHTSTAATHSFHHKLHILITLYPHGVESPSLSADASPLALLMWTRRWLFLYSTPNSTSPLILRRPTLSVRLQSLLKLSVLLASDCRSHVEHKHACVFKYIVQRCTKKGIDCYMYTRTVEPHLSRPRLSGRSHYPASNFVLSDWCPPSSSCDHLLRVLFFNRKELDAFFAVLF